MTDFPDPTARLLAVFGACFPVFAKPLPLKLGIHRDIKAAMPELSMTKIRRALAAVTRQDAYRQALVPGRQRFDLNAQPAGVVTDAEVEHRPLLERGRSRWGRLRKKIRRAYKLYATIPTPDLQQVEVWRAAGYEPEICATIVTEGVKRHPRIVSLKYFDVQLFDAHARTCQAAE